ncbi:unnamed protein product, partial [Sphacelaria rigidula]
PSPSPLDYTERTGCGTIDVVWPFLFRQHEIPSPYRHTQRHTPYWIRWSDEKRYSTRAPCFVPHRSTSLARHRSTSQSGRDVVLSTWYGRFFTTNHPHHTVLHRGIPRLGEPATGGNDRALCWVNSIRASHVVHYRSTSRARRLLTPQSGRDVVLPTWYGR